MKKLVIVAVLLAVGAFVGNMKSADACHDNWDEVIAKLRTLDLTKVQLDTFFSFGKSLAQKRAEDHRDGYSCSHHQVHVKAYEQTAIGMLDDGQFKKYTGRERTEVESLRREVDELKVEVAALKKQMRELQAAMKK